MHKETLNRLIKEYKGEDLADYLSAEIDREKDLLRKLQEIQKETEKEVKRHKLEKNRIEILELDLQKECPHYEHTFHGDPSGNNDSYTTCDLCGKEL